MRRAGRPVRKTFPLNLIIDSRTVLVIGGGQVGRRKVRLLLNAGAKVELICPDAVDALIELAVSGEIVWTKRCFQEGDEVGRLLVFACTDDKHVNRAVLDASRRANVPCCCADLNWADGDFTTPAIANVGDITISVSTSGQNCKESRDVRNEILATLAERKDLQLVVVGTSDALLPSRRRAQYHLPAEERNALGRLIPHIRGVREFFILNTCNRVELAVVVSHEVAVIDILKRLTGFDKLSRDEYFVLCGYEAFRHLTLVASGLESSLLGEFHIVSQVKDALEEAALNKWSGPAIRFTVAEVLRVSKAVRHKVEGSLHVAEIDQVAVGYLSVHGGLDDKTHVMVIGTGMVGSGAVQSLVKMGVEITWIYHVHKPDVSVFGDDARIDVLPMSGIRGALGACDVVMSAVDSSKPVVTSDMCERVMDRNVLFVDLGVPRNVDAFYDDFGHGVTVADLDDLKLWHRVKTGTIKEVMSKADEVIRSEYKAML